MSAPFIVTNNNTVDTILMQTYQVQARGRAQFLVVDGDRLRWTATFAEATQFARLDAAVIAAARVDGHVCASTWL